MANEWSNHGKAELLKGSIDIDNDSMKMILMQTAFSFDKDADATYSDVSASELATANGYTAGGQVLTTPLVTEDDTNDRADFTYDNVTWTASGGDIVASGAIIFDDTTGDDTIIGYIDFGGDKTASDGGGTLTVANGIIRLS